VYIKSIQSNISNIFFNLILFRVNVKLELVGSCSTLIAEELLSDPDFSLDKTAAELLYGN